MTRVTTGVAPRDTTADMRLDMKPDLIKAMPTARKRDIRRGIPPDTTRVTLIATIPVTKLATTRASAPVVMKEAQEDTTQDSMRETVQDIEKAANNG